MVTISADEFKKHVDYDPVVGDTYDELRYSHGKEAADEFLKSFIADQAAAAYAAAPQVNGFLYVLANLTAFAWAGIVCFVVSLFLLWHSISVRADYRDKAKKLGYVAADNSQWFKVAGFPISVKDVRPNGDGSKITINVEGHRRGEPLDLYGAAYDAGLHTVGTDIIHLSPVGSGIVVANSKMRLDGAEFVYFYAEDRVAIGN